MLRSLLLYLSGKDGLKNFLMRRPAGRRLAARFIAGETLQDAVRVVRALNEAGFDVTLDYLGESVHAPDAAAEAGRVYLSILDRIAAEGLRSHVSIKLTQLGLAIDPELARMQLAALAEQAARHHNFIRIDMEGSAYTESTLRLFRQVNASRDVLGVAIQTYLYRSEQDVQDLLKFGACIRLVKGAYQEPPEIAFARKADVDRNFIRLTERLLSSGGYHAIATHDPRMIAATQAFGRALGLGSDRYEFQMLYGIRRDLQRMLLREAYRVRVYVPYGRQWYAYFMRRLAERPANVFFLLRNLLRK